MKTKNAIPPALLSSPTERKLWTVYIDMGKGVTAKMEFTDRQQAQSEYDRCRQQGIYAGRWIEEITINEQVCD